MKLFPKDKVVGVFRGFSQGGLEFHAELVLPYRSEFQRIPMHGQFLLVQLESEHEAVLGRITSLSAQGRLSSGAGEDFNIRAVAEDRPIPEDLREQYLKYQVAIRVLGVLRVSGDGLVFAASHRRLPHVGSKVAFLSTEVLREVAGHNVEGAELGYFTLGEFVYAAGDSRLTPEPWMQVCEPLVISRFDVHSLVARRTFVFARAGFGKSNLVKLLFANLYRETPTVPKRGGRQVPVGTIIFDPDGEYFWPDDKNRPGLCDVPELQDKIVVFTGKQGPSPYYDAFVAGPIKLDIRRLNPGDVVGIALDPERQEQQNVRKLKALGPENWSQMVDEIHRHGLNADDGTIAGLLGLRIPDQQAELNAAKANMLHIIRMLHDPSSALMDMLLEALKDGKICVVDVSMLRGGPALALSGLILKRIFDRNQYEFTRREPQTIPTIAVVEEAQSVLGAGKGNSGQGPYVEWVKEGRKYDLGAVLITQQPGSIPHEILSQGDNWFLLHLLSAGDLKAVKSANAHYSDDLLASLLNEPIPGNGIFWSSVKGKSYPVAFRALSFEGMHQAQDPTYDRPPPDCYARRLRERYGIGAFQGPLFDSQTEAGAEAGAGMGPEGFPDEENPARAQGPDRLREACDRAIAAFGTSPVADRIRAGEWVPWNDVKLALARHIPDTFEDRYQIAYRLVRQALDATFGEGGWRSERRPRATGNGETAHVTLERRRQPDQGEEG